MLPQEVVSQPKPAYSAKRLRQDVEDTKFLIYSSSIQVTERDRDFLGPDQKLNDTIVNFLSFHLLNQVHVSVQNQFHFFQSFWFSKLDNRSSLSLAPFQVYESVRNETRGIDLFSKRIVLIPVNKGFHWSLAVVQFIPQDISLPPHARDK